jgi:hypothetical protein
LLKPLYIDSGDFALLVKNVIPGSRPIQQLGSRDVFFNDIEQLPGGPMPHDGKTYMRCKRSGKGSPAKEAGAKEVTSAPLGKTKKDHDSRKPHPVVAWASRQIAVNGWMEIINVCLLVAAVIGGVYYGWNQSKTPSGFFLIMLLQTFARWIRSFF